MILRVVATVAIAAMLGACAGLSRENAATSERLSIPRLLTSPEPGAIYGGGFDLFADLRARDTGDILTIRLVESTNAENESSTSSSKGSNLDTGFPIIAGRPVTAGGTEILNNQIEADRSFSGQSDSSQSNRIEGTITVTVVERLANGNLVVEGEKWIAINRGEELIRLSGIIRPVDIGPDNSIASTKVANARIDYRGLGTLADSNRPGWLTRFFNSPWFPF